MFLPIGAAGLLVAEGALVVAVEVRDATPLPQLLRQSGRDRNRSDAVIGLRIADAEDVRDQVDVIPAERL